MAKTKNSNDLMTGAAKIIGGALGTIAGAVDRFNADHPHPVDEAKGALAAGQQQVAQVAKEAGSRATAMVEAAKAVIKKVRPRSATVRARAAQAPSRGARKIGKQAKRAATKTVKRAKKVVARTRKSATRSRAARRRKR